MLRRLVLSIARRSYRLLPLAAQQKLRGEVTKRSYAAHTRGLEEDFRMKAWTTAHTRPVTIVIPSYNDFELLSSCLESLARTISHLDYEVIIVDDYCEAANTERLKTLASDRVRLIFKPERRGFAVSVNMGMADAASDRDIVLLNSDIVALPGWLDALQYSAYAIDEKIGMVSPRLLYPNGTIQYGGTYYARVLAPQWFGHLYVGTPPSRIETSIPGYNRSISGACVYVTRAAYTSLGGLDEEYWLGFEDVDYGLTAWENDIRCYYQPASTLIHHESASRGYSQGTRELASMRRFWRRWAPMFLDRVMAEPFEADFIVSDSSDAVWRQYIDELAARLSETGVRTRVHRVDVDVVDEALIEELSPRQSLKICCDWGAQRTAWLGSLSTGKAVYMLPHLETLDFPADRHKQAEILVGYRPEFDYIAPNRWTAQRITAESAWEVQHRIVPVLQPPAQTEGAGDCTVVVIAGTEEQRSRVRRVARDNGATCVELDDPQTTPGAREAIAVRRPRVVVSFTEYRNSATPLFLMSLGAAFIGVSTDQTRYETLDGFNMLNVDTGDLDQLSRSLEDVLANDQVWNELQTNGRATATSIYDRNTVDVVDALQHVARTAV
jgi:GT2 family glycosyltransferase